VSNFGKVSPGQPWKPPRADQQNAWDEAADYFQVKQQLSVPSPQHFFPRPTDLIRVKNDSGADRDRGDVLELDSFLLESLAAESLWFSGVVPTADDKPYCVLLKPIPNGEIGQGQISGVCIAKLNNSDPALPFGKAREGQTKIETVACGNAHIFHREEIEGQWWAVVRLSNPSCGGACDFIRFSILAVGTNARGIRWAQVTVLSRPSGGCTEVPEEVAGEIPRIYDMAGCYLNEPDADLIGRIGYAKYMQDEQFITEAIEPGGPVPDEAWEVTALCCPSCVVAE